MDTDVQIHVTGDTAHVHGVSEQGTEFVDSFVAADMHCHDAGHIEIPKAALLGLRRQLRICGFSFTEE